jgi:hypothetical protein
MYAKRIVFLPLLILCIHVSGQNIIWSDDFSNPATWQTSIAPGAPNTPWTIGTQPAAGDFPLEIIQSTTAGNNFALLDSDFHGSENATATESSMLTTALPVDLSSQPHVLLQFETFYRKWTYEECFVVISTNNMDWPALDPDYDAANDPRVFKVFPGMAVQAPMDNPTLVRLNISAVAGGQPEVWVRFHWTGSWGYSWYVDDVAIVEQPEFDLQLLDAGIAPAGGFIEYGRIPASQMNGFGISSNGYNFGFGTHSGIQLHVNVMQDQNGPIVFDGSQAVGPIAPGDSLHVWFPIPFEQLDPGLYIVEVKLLSDQEPAGTDNLLIRSFEVSQDRYSIDNIGNHPIPEVLGTLGSNTFANNENGMMMMSQYNVSSPLVVHGLEVILQTGPAGTTAGTSITAAIYDSLDIFIDSFNYTPDLSNPLTDWNLFYTITQQDVANGKVELAFTEPLTLPAGAFYASVELFAGDFDQRIRIMDDQTLQQPGFASLIYLPNSPSVGGEANRIWSNGNAFAIRLITDPETVAPDPCLAHFLVMQGMTLPDSIPVPGLVWIIDNTTGGTGTYSYTWDMGDGTVYTDPNPSHDFLTNGPFMVCLTIVDDEDCTDTYCQEISVDDAGMINGMFPGGGAMGFSVQVLPSPIITEIDEHSKGSHLQLWPNPAGDHLMFSTSASGMMRIDVLDIKGRPVLQRNVSISADGIGTLPVNALAPGTYIFRMNSQDGVKEQRFIKL